jgi:hypothetical protein
MKKEKMSPHIIAVTALAVFIVLGLACATTGGSSEAITSAASIDEVTGLANKLTWLRANVENGGDYIIEINTDESINNGFVKDGNLSYKNKSNITITLRGVGENRIITTNLPPGQLFIVGSGVTLVLDENITLQGLRYDRPMNSYDSMVNVFSGGTFIMNDGSAITGGTNNSSNGGGVYVSDGGTFLMKGGIISGNLCYPSPRNAEAYRAGSALGGSLGSAAVSGATGGRVTVQPDTPTNPVFQGGGVYVSSKISFLGKTIPGGTFTKTGGTITGYASDQRNGNVVRDPYGNALQNSGHAVYAGSKRKETTAGPEVNLHISSDGTFSGDWDY